MLEAALKEIGPLVSYHQQVFRIVETQAYAATTTLVDDLNEQALLEQMLDEVKPPYKTMGHAQTLHYLISTPFRYPPLKYGSRFGSRYMAGYFYASEDELTSLAECAYYRFCFLAAMSEPYRATIQSDHMMFSVSVSSHCAADLTKVSTGFIIDSLKGQRDYSFTQALGKMLVEEHSAKVIRYFSARSSVRTSAKTTEDANVGINVAIATPSEITSAKPENSVNWICHTTEEVISFNSRGLQCVSFPRSQFCVNGEFSQPA
ncbi:MAG: hypothetical protein ACI8WB_006017 [Phenylobacterium sp.]|jgi:hypothetical protein